MELVKNIFFNTDKIVEGTTVKVSYIGYLYQNGSNNVYLHYGFGENWNNVGEVKMEKTELGYQAEIAIPNGYHTLNLCYKNENDEWDNNYGKNFTFSIEKKDVGAVSEKARTITRVGAGISTGNTLKSINWAGTEINNKTEAKTYGSVENVGTSTSAQGALFNKTYSSAKPSVNSNTVGSTGTTTTSKVGVSNTSTSSTSKTDVSSHVTVENIKTNSVIANTASSCSSENGLTVTNQNGMQVRKGLRKTYIWSKKIKLAIYKIIKYVPKIISGNYKRKVDEQ